MSIDDMRLRVFQAVAADAVEFIEDAFKDESLDYGEAVCRALSYARAEGFQEMARLLIANQSLDEELNLAFSKYTEGGGYWKLKELSGVLQTEERPVYDAS